MKNKNIKYDIGERKQKQADRREFIKKATYSAPVLITMGQLVKPEKTDANCSSVPGWR